MQLRWLLGAIAAFAATAGSAHADQPYVGEVRLLAFNFCPVGWLPADGSLLSIAENDVLFSLYGTTFGGDGESTFALPDLRGRVPIATGTGPGLSTRLLGEQAGSEQVTLTTQQLPAHTHAAGASSQSANATNPGGKLLAAKSRTATYRTGSAANTPGAADAIAVAGGSQPHENMPPFTTLSWCVSLFGVYPNQN